MKAIKRRTVWTAACALVIPVAIIAFFLFRSATPRLVEQAAAAATEPVSQSKPEPMPNKVETVKTAAQAEPFDPNRTPRKPGFSRPEDRGEDFAKLATDVVVERLAIATDIAEQRKATKVLGDRDLTGKLDLSAEQSKTLDEYAEKQISLTAAKTGNDRTEANQNIQRMWRVAANRLVENLGSKNMAIAEAATKNLVKMRNEEIIKKIIAKVRASTDKQTRYMGVFALGMMNERSYTLIDDRPLMGPEASQELVAKHIIPFFKELREQDADPKMQQMISNAYHYLANPFDTRPRRVNQADIPAALQSR